MCANSVSSLTNLVLKVVLFIRVPLILFSPTHQMQQMLRCSIHCSPFFNANFVNLSTKRGEGAHNAPSPHLCKLVLQLCNTDIWWGQKNCKITLMLTIYNHDHRCCAVRREWVLWAIWICKVKNVRSEIARLLSRESPLDRIVLHTADAYCNMFNFTPVKHSNRHLPETLHCTLQSNGHY